MRTGTIGLFVFLGIAGLAGCGSSTRTPAATTTRAANPVTLSALAASMKGVLISKYRSPQPLNVDCRGTGQVVSCDAVSTAGRGYRVTVKGPCWTATFNGKIIEGPGFVPPSQRPTGRVATGPDNLPDTFSGCVR